MRIDLLGLYFKLRNAGGEARVADILAAAARQYRMSHEAAAKLLWNMEAEGLLHLMPIDDPTRMSDADRAAGELFPAPRHVVLK